MKSLFLFIAALVFLLQVPFMTSCRFSASSADPGSASEDAENANPEAVEDSSTMKVRGTIKEISHTISPETAAYDDCNFTLLIDDADSSNCYYVKVPMFIKRSFTAFAGKKIGDPIEVRMIPYEETSEAVQEIQTVDDINDFEKQLFYADALDGKVSNGALSIDPEKRAVWLKKLLQETELQMSEYEKQLSRNEKKREKEIDEVKDVSFKAVQKPYGYFFQAPFFVQTRHYNPTLLQGIKDLSEKCRGLDCELIVVPCISPQEYSDKELLTSFRDIPFFDYGREKLVYDCLKNDILALDTNQIIRTHQDAEYLPFSLLGDNHFSIMTNLFVADEIVSNLDIKRNDYTIRKDYFLLSSMHTSYYSGPSRVMMDPVFEKPNSPSSGKPAILVAGDSFTTTNNFHSHLSSLALCDVQVVRHDAGPNTALFELLEGKYDSILQDASVLVYIFCSPYTKMNYPTGDLVELTSRIKRNEILFYNVPIADAPKSVTVVRPEGFSASEPLKAIVDISPITSKYSVSVNYRHVFDYDCDFLYNNGDNRIVLQIEPDDFEDGKVELQINGNASFRTIILVDSSSKD